MSSHEHTEFKFELRGDLTPRSLTASALAEFITELEKLLRSLTRSTHSNLKSEQLRSSVVGIEAGSVNIIVAPSVPDLVMPVAARMADDLNNRRVEDWPSNASNSLKNIRALANVIGASARVSVPVNGHVVEASFTDPEGITHLENLRGPTTVYGRVTRLGGVKPKVDLVLAGGKQMLHCDADEPVVKSLEGQLYEYVSLNGLGQWDPFTLELKQFKVESWQPFANRNPVEAMEALREQFGRYFDDIDDVDAWVSDLRSEGDE